MVEGTINNKYKILSGKPMQDLRGYLTEEQVQTLFEACSTDRERLLIRMLWKTGRRVGEILGLQVKDIDFITCNILWHIEKKNILKKRRKETPEKFEERKKHPKPDYPILKPIDRASIGMLKDYIVKERLGHEDYIFYSPFIGRGKPLTRFRIFQLIRKIGERAGIARVGNKGIHPHHFRHSFAVHIVRNAKNPAAIALLQKALEHNNINITMNYLQFSQEDLREIIEED